jgi:transcriptional regulator with XRE-family HTH domain
MINKKVTEIARQKLGDFLRSERERKGLTKYRIMQNSGMTIDQVNAIEAGSKSYTIDALLAYVTALDCYFNLSLPDREGRHLDLEDMARKLQQSSDDQAALDRQAGEN